MANLDKNKKKIAEQVAPWSENDFAELVKIYDKTHKAKHKQLLSKLYSSDMEKQLIENGINSSCPYCGSDKIVKRGRDSHKGSSAIIALKTLLVLPTHSLKKPISTGRLGFVSLIRPYKDILLKE